MNQLKWSIADQYRELEYNAAVKVQAWYRRLRVKAYFKHLNESCVCIQRFFRGYLGRKAFRQILDVSNQLIIYLLIQL